MDQNRTELHLYPPNFDTPELKITGGIPELFNKLQDKGKKIASFNMNYHT